MASINYKSFIGIFLLVVLTGVSYFFISSHQLVRPVITDRVQIHCYFGNKQVFEAKDIGLMFESSDFDANGVFIRYEKNADLQKLCGISNEEATGLLNKWGDDAPKLLEVMLSKV